MTIVFDEVRGSVEPEQAPAARDETQAAPSTADEKAPDEIALERYLRRRAWLLSRRLAD